MSIRAINALVLVRPREAPKTTAGGIHLPDAAREEQGEGEVIAVAEDATEEVAVGDRVIYSESSGTEVAVNSEKYILVPSEDLLAKYEAADEIPE